MNQRRNSAQFRRDQHRPRGVAADAENDIRMMAADEFEGLRKLGGQADETFDRIAEAFAFQAADGDELKRETGYGNDRLFEAAFRTDEDDAPRGVARHPLLRDGNGRVDVSSRPASGDHQRLPHSLHAHSADSST